MPSPDEKMKHMERLRRKKKEKMRSSIAKDLLTSGKYKPRVILDKRGRKHDLNRMDHLMLVEAIQELNDE